MTTQQILLQYFGDKSAKAKNLAEGDSLLERGLLDSMAIVKLIAFIEERFGVVLGDDEFDPDNFETVDAIAKLIEQKSAAAS
ncbi:MAG: acyl carrier protein [Polyangiaceae bacterium]|nr:acyl carrier protein [Polyangiaceae bacterium]